MPSGPSRKSIVRPSPGCSALSNKQGKEMSKKILVLPGDGIGTEIIAEAVKVLQAADAKFDLQCELSDDDLGGAAYDRYGTPLADETLARAREVDAILLGAVGGPKWDNIDPALRPERGLLK